MRTTIFTGAGASRAIGYPLTNELLPRVRSGLETGELFHKLKGSGRRARVAEGIDRRLLGSYLSRLLPGFRSAGDTDLPLITDVFSLVEYALMAGDALVGGESGQLRQFRDLLKQAITDVLLDDFETPWDGHDPDHQRERCTLGKFVDWIAHLGESCGIVSTNYDIGIEYELYGRVGSAAVKATTDLGFDWRSVGRGTVRTRPVNPGIRIYKLHGSLDLLRCSACGHVYFNPEGTIAHQPFRLDLDEANSCHCRNDLRLDLHIVAPSYVRDIRDANLLSVWRSALEWMRTSDRWIIVGYSLPPEDLAIRSMLLRAYQTTERKPPKVVVVQRGSAMRSRYEVLFPGCVYHVDGLEAFMERL